MAGDGRTADGRFAVERPRPGCLADGGGTATFAGMTTLIPATRTAGLERLAAFAPGMGAAYAAGRNHASGLHGLHSVSGLSAYLRHRLVLEAEAVGAALATHGDRGAEKFIQEVFWRTYWKGWLELRPAVWTAYSAGVAQEQARLRTSGGLRRQVEAAVSGRTGIACFDAWAAELVETNYLHNHVRMWFASIWIFTLKLPWVLGADFFLLHLRDGDPASNTLSWRWVAGSQTRGKHYVARAENIRRFTDGQFDPQGELDESPEAIVEPDAQGPQPLPPAAAPPTGPVALLLHEDDLHAESLDLGGAEVMALAGTAFPERRSPLGCAGPVAEWVQAAVADGRQRASRHFGIEAAALAPAEVVAWAGHAGCAAVVTPWAPVGWTADGLAAIEAGLRERGILLHRLRRPWDKACWPLATKGFFPFREAIPRLLAGLF